MPSSVPAAFTVGSFAPDFKPNSLQEFANEFARLLQPVAVATPSGTLGTYIKGGTEPLNDQGPWLPDGKREFWFYDATYGHYYPSGPTPGTFAIFGNILNDPGDNWLYCDGSIKPQAAYPRLFAKIGHSFAATDANGSQASDAASLQASGQFRVPDGSGRVLVGTGAARGVPTPDGFFDITARPNAGKPFGAQRVILTNGNIRCSPYYAIGHNFDATKTQPTVSVYMGRNWDPAKADGTPEDAASFDIFQPGITGHIHIRF